MSVELAMLVATALLSLAVAALTIAIHFARYGGKTIRGNRDEYPTHRGIAGRVVRAHASLNEALLPFAILVFAATATHAATRLTAFACEAFFVARLAHLVFYLAGAAPWRSIAFYAGLAATLLLASQLPITR